MRRLTVATISVAASLALAACAERDTTSPRSISPGQASLAGGPNSTACDFTNISKAAKDYFTSAQDPVYDTISTWSSAYKTSGAALATSHGWGALTLVANERLTTATNDGSFGAVFVVMAARCMADLSTNPAGAQLQLPATLTANNNALLTRVLNSGIWEIRNGGHTGAPAAGKNKTAGARALGSPVWGVETLTSAALWPGTIQYAVVGYPVKDTDPLLNSAPQIDQFDDLGLPGATYQTTGVWAFNAFELLTVPTGAVPNHSNLRVGICVSSNPGGVGNVNFLVHSDLDLVANSSPTQLCSGTLQASVGTPLPWYSRLARGAAGLFRPGILFAQFDDGGFIGGLPSGWSPFHGGTLNVSNLTFKVFTQPNNNVADSTDNSLVVRATVTSTGTPVPQVSVDSIVVFNNNGTPAGAVIVPGTTNLAQLTGACDLPTDPCGKATVTFQIGKPGAYILVVWGSLDGAVFNASTSKFNVKNQ